MKTILQMIFNVDLGRPTTYHASARRKRIDGRTSVKELTATSVKPRLLLRAGRSITPHKIAMGWHGRAGVRFVPNTVVHLKDACMLEMARKDCHMASRSRKPQCNAANDTMDSYIDWHHETPIQTMRNHNKDLGICESQMVCKVHFCRVGQGSRFG